MTFPGHHDLMDCPHCKGRACAFAVGEKAIGWPHDKSGMNHQIEVAHCLSCGYPIVHYARQSQSGLRVSGAVVYPIAPYRDLAPNEVHSADPDLAKDYDEAVACEPHSLQAAAMLLGRCASHILVARCGADKSSTLGAQISAAVKAGDLPEPIKEQSEGLLAGRNQAAHPWYAASGAQMKIDQQGLDWCFDIVDLMFVHFYVNPARLAERQAKLAATKGQKV